MTASANLDLVRSIFTAWERGDFFSSGERADPEIELIQADGPEPSRATGLAEMAAAWAKRLNTFADVRVEAEEYRELDDSQVLVLVRSRGVAKTSGIDLDQIGGERTALLLSLRDGKVMRLVAYFDRDRALADLGLMG
jgi:ketosteroid isomerase-like protein